MAGKSAVVTGGAQGLGLAIASELATRGCEVALADINAGKAESSAALLTSEGKKAYAIAGDVSTRSGCAALVAGALGKLGKIDILVNNAGVLHTESIKSTTEEEWDRVLAVNLKGVFFMSQAALPHLRKSPAPRIVNISSLAGRMGGYKTGLAYSASKGAVISLTMGMARQLAPDRITVNCISPGTAETEMIKGWSYEAIQSLREKIPLGRLGRGTDVAAAVAFLASEAAEFVTGVCLDVNGGMFTG
ncbi:MAG: glucose 1-dehydrogenase [Planctomycetes bacterium]|nr:glucose 1-dehydrogenase [Planctomycetota bacterium]